MRSGKSGALVLGGLAMAATVMTPAANAAGDHGFVTTTAYFLSEKNAISYTQYPQKGAQKQALALCKQKSTASTIAEPVVGLARVNPASNGFYATMYWQCLS